MSKRLKNILINLGLLAALAILVLALAALLLYRRIPDGFRDYGEDVPAELKTASHRFTEKQLALLDPSTRPDSMEISEDEINGYIRYGFESRAEYIPAEISSPQVRFRDGRIVVAGRLRDGKSFSTVVSVEIEPVNRDGRVGWRVAKCGAGSLPVSGGRVDRLIRKIEKKDWDLKGYRVDIEDGVLRLRRMKKEPR